MFTYYITSLTIVFILFTINKMITKIIKVTPKGGGNYYGYCDNGTILDLQDVKGHICIVGFNRDLKPCHTPLDFTKYRLEVPLEDK